MLSTLISVCVLVRELAGSFYIKESHRVVTQLGHLVLSLDAFGKCSVFTGTGL